MKKETPKILLISFSSFLKKFDHTYPQEIVKQTGWNLKVAVPPFWKSSITGIRQNLEKYRSDLFEIVLSPVNLPGSFHFAAFRDNLKKAISEFQPHIIDFENGPLAISSLQLLKYCRNLSPSSKIVFRFNPAFVRSQLDISAFNYIIRKNFPVIIAETPEPEAETQPGLSENKTIFLPPGVNTDVFRPRELPELRYQLNPQNKKVVGILAENSRDLLSVLTNVSTIEEKILFIICMNKKDAGLEKKISKFNHDVFSINEATHEELAQYMNCIDIFMAPGIRKNRSFAKQQRFMLEMMSSGVAVLSPDAVENKKIFGNSALLFHKSDFADMREKLKFLLRNDSQRNEYRWQARKRVNAHFTWSKIARKTVKFYSSLLTD